MKQEASKDFKKNSTLTQDDLGKSLGKSRAAVANSMRLLQLSKDVQDLLQAGSLNMGHARPLLSLPEGVQESFAKKLVKMAYQLDKQKLW